MNRGFTVVEVVVTLVVIMIIMTLSVVGMRGVLANARDTERSDDVQAIARGLEARYKQGNPVITGRSNPDDAQKGSYPSVQETYFMDGIGNFGGYTPSSIGSIDGTTTMLPGTSLSSFTSPLASRAWYVITCYQGSPPPSPCQPAGSQFNASYPFLNGSVTDWYAYEPYDANGNICSTGVCTGYNLYWKSEVDTTVTLGVPGLKIVKSIHR